MKLKKEASSDPGNVVKTLWKAGILGTTNKFDIAPKKRGGGKEEGREGVGRACQYFNLHLSHVPSSAL